MHMSTYVYHYTQSVDVLCMSTLTTERLRHQDSGSVYYLFASQIHTETSWEEQKTSCNQSNFHFYNMKDF